MDFGIWTMEYREILIIFDSVMCVASVPVTVWFEVGVCLRVRFYIEILIIVLKDYEITLSLCADNSDEPVVIVISSFLNLLIFDIF